MVSRLRAGGLGGWLSASPTSSLPEPFTDAGPLELGDHLTDPRGLGGSSGSTVCLSPPRPPDDLRRPRSKLPVWRCPREALPRRGSRGCRWPGLALGPRFPLRFVVEGDLAPRLGPRLPASHGPPPAGRRRGSRPPAPPSSPSVRTCHARSTPSASATRLLGSPADVRRRAWPSLAVNAGMASRGARGRCGWGSTSMTDSRSFKESAAAGHHRLQRATAARAERAWSSRCRSARATCGSRGGGLPWSTKAASTRLHRPAVRRRRRPLRSSTVTTDIRLHVPGARDEALVSPRRPTGTPDPRAARERGRPRRAPAGLRRGLGPSVRIGSAVGRAVPPRRTPPAAVRLATVPRVHNGGCPTARGRRGRSAVGSATFGRARNSG